MFVTERFPGNKRISTQSRSVKVLNLVKRIHGGSSGLQINPKLKGGNRELKKVEGSTDIHSDFQSVICEDLRVGINSGRPGSPGRISRRSVSNRAGVYPDRSKYVTTPSTFLLFSFLFAYRLEEDRFLSFICRPKVFS